MAKFLAGIYFVLCVIHLVYELINESFKSGFEAVLTMGITAIGIYLSWVVMTKKFRD